MKTFVLLLTSLMFVSCSNMTVGFEEDSPFYNGPVIDTREDVHNEKETEVQADTITEAKEAVVEDEVKEKMSKEVNIEVTKETAPQDNETTFSYERDDD